NFATAWGGIASLELSIGACAAGLMGPRSGCDAAAAARRIAAWMSAGPARLAGLDRKGRIAVGCDADGVVWNPDAEWTVGPRGPQQRHRLTPYAGRTLRGRVHATFVRGSCVWRDGGLAAAANGRLL